MTFTKEKSVEFFKSGLVEGTYHYEEYGNEDIPRCRYAYQLHRGVRIFKGEKWFVQLVFKSGRSTKPLANYRYPHNEKGLNHMNQAWVEFQKRYDRDVKWQLEKIESKKSHTINVGDVFSTSWGYDQTNVDFYLVLEQNAPQTFTLVEIGANRVEGSECGDSCHLTPNPTHRIGEPFKKRLNSYGGFNISDVQHATPYTCGEKGQFCSWWR
jgi:hypothetical protein